MAGYSGWPGKYSKKYNNVLCNVGLLFNSAWGLVGDAHVLEVVLYNVHWSLLAPKHQATEPPQSPVCIYLTSRQKKQYEFSDEEVDEVEEEEEKRDLSEGRIWLQTEDQGHSHFQAKGQAQQRKRVMPRIAQSPPTTNHTARTSTSRSKHRNRNRSSPRQPANGDGRGQQQQDLGTTPLARMASFGCA
jgi:hypothetical protein